MTENKNSEKYTLPPLQEKIPAPWVRHIADNFPRYLVGMSGLSMGIAAWHFSIYSNMEPLSPDSRQDLNQLNKTRSFIKDWATEMPEVALDYTKKSIADVLENKELSDRVPEVSELRKELANLEQITGGYVPALNSANETLETVSYAMARKIGYNSESAAEGSLVSGAFSLMLATFLLFGAYKVQKGDWLKDRSK